MYWFRTGAGLGLLALLALLAIWTVGGSLLASTGFRLGRRELPLVGLALGVTLSIWLANLFGRWMAPTAAFWSASLAVPAAGLLAARRSKLKVAALADAGGWGLLVIALALAGTSILVGRGIGILDDRKNLSFISTMAAGDIPPHFYMNPEVVPAYHYGFQLFGAMLMRTAGMFPWSAFDVAKGLAAGLTLTLAALVGWRVTHRGLGSAVAALVVGLASGSRWLLLFLPQGLLRSISSQVTLWGSAATTAPNLYDALATGWVVGDGPPVPIPFAFVNGILEPFVLGSQAGPGSLSLVVLLLVILVLPRARHWLSAAILIPVLAGWALISEAEFVLYAGGLGVVAVVLSGWVAAPAWRRALRIGMAAVTLAGFLSFFQGGTLTEMRRDLFSGAQGDPGSGDVGGFSLRWPPAIVSSHLGELSLVNPRLVLAGVFELGPPLLVAPVALWMSKRYAERGRFELSSLGVASMAGLLLPLILRFQTDRDITRLSAFGLLGSAVLCLPAIFTGLRATKAAWLRWASLGWITATCFGGIVVLGSLMTAIPRATLSPDIAPIDARMADRFWDRLDQDTLVLDSHPWRAVALTGRLTKSAPTALTTLPEWEQLVADPRLSAVTAAGYRYVYVDEYWWQRMGGQSENFLAAPCARLLGMETDDQANGSRRLFDLKDCATP